MLAAGRLVEEKGFHTLLDAFAMLLERRRARLIVLGKGPQLSVLLSQAEALRVRQHVDFPGFVANPYPYMANANLFVLSSRVGGVTDGSGRSDGMWMPRGQHRLPLRTGRNPRRWDGWVSWYR